MDLNTTPAMAAPVGQMTNFNVGMTDMQRQFIIINIGMIAGATVTLALRLWVRARVIKKVGLDDYVVVAAWAMGIGFFVCCIQWMNYGLGEHLWNVSLAQLAKYAQWSIPVVTTYCWAPMLSKFSILITYLRLNRDKTFRIGIYALMTLIFGYTLATTLVVSAGCKPTDPTKVQCIDTLALVQAILNIVCDGMIIVIPIPMLQKLQLPVGQKIAVGLVLAGGSFVVVASIVRLVYIQALPQHVDFTAAEAEVCNWSAIEINVGIMCQCLVALKPLVKRYVPRIFGYSDGRPLSETLWRKVFPSRASKHSSTGRTGGYPLRSIDRARPARGAGKQQQHADGAFTKDDIVITQSYDVQSIRESAGPGTHDLEMGSTENIIRAGGHDLR